MPAPSLRRILETLDRHGVEYVVVGGVAAVLHGAPVTTFDIDALVKVDRENSARLGRVLAALDARYREHETLKPSPADVAAGGYMLPVTDSGPLDVLGFIGGGKRYEDVAAAAETVTIGGSSVRIISLEQLIEEKKALGRDKDMAALRLLESLAKRRGGRS